MDFLEVSSSSPLRARKALYNTCSSFLETVTVGETAHDRVSDPKSVAGLRDACAQHTRGEQVGTYCDTPWKGDLLFNKRWHVLLGIAALHRLLKVVSRDAQYAQAG